ncbi:MAG: hypothetical protein GY832_21550 [Chloroflexi bacterium]|nr:hypothetical protein [Chloroflexota bacterium]
MTAFLPSHRLALRLARFHRACWWLRLGVSLVPLKPRSKHIQTGYGSHKACISDPAFARKWFLNTDANLGVLLGGTTGLLVADWDDAQTFRLWRSSIGASVATLTEQTARGYHVFFFGPDLPSAANQNCEFIASGVCMVTPSIHPSGFVYRITHHAPITTIAPRSAIRLFPFLSEALLPKPSANFKTSPSTSSVGDLIARIKTARSTLDEMCATGITFHPVSSSTLVALCPFHDDHSPTLWLNPHSGLWGCNRLDCSASGTHDVINFRALSRRISNRSAIRQLTAEFL